MILRMMPRQQPPAANSVQDLLKIVVALLLIYKMDIGVVILILIKFINVPKTNLIVYLTVELLTNIPSKEETLF
jgi:hypothetical protein